MENDPLPTPLDREIETYRHQLPQLLATGQAGRFVLIKGAQVIGVWDIQGDALAAGREQFGLQPIAVKRIDPCDVGLLARMGTARGAR